MNDLVFGKDKTERIVGLEVNHGNTELFIRDEDGKISSEVRPNRFWIVSRNALNKKSVRLEGNLFYRYFTSTPDRDLFTEGRRLWKNKDIYSVYSEKESFMVHNGVTYFKGMKHTELCLLSFDIETTGLTHDKNSKVLLISNTFRDSKGNVERRLFSYDEFDNEAEMLLAWTEFVRERDPDSLVFHNGFSFDLPYMQYIADRNNITLDLGRDGSAIKFNKHTSSYRIDGTRDLDYRSAHIYGREIIDTMFLAYKYDVGRKYPSYSLKKIIAYEGLEVKNREFYDASQIRFNYKNPIEWKKIKRYAEMDADDSVALFDLMAPSQFYWTQKVPKSFQAITESATGSQINAILTRAYLQDNHSLPHTSPVEGFRGAISYAKPGIYTNHIRFDVASLYPSIILQYELYDKEKDPKGYYYQLTKILREQRLKNKELSKKTGEKYYKDMEQSEKIGINSIYGAAGAPGLLFNSPRTADAITRYGREILSKAVLWASGQDVKDWIGQEDEVAEDEL